MSESGVELSKKADRFWSLCELGGEAGLIHPLHAHFTMPTLGLSFSDWTVRGMHSPCGVICRSGDVGSITQTHDSIRNHCLLGQNVH